jgi:hypothetical protein
MAYKINPITGKMDLVGGNSISESDSGLSSEEVQELITENLDNPENLVTEDENGIARAIDKKVTDKSMINSVILSAQFASAAEASKRLTEVSDGFYSPVHAQTMHWVDLNGNLHLSRYSEALGISGLDRKPLCWLGGAVNENKVVVLTGINSNKSDVGELVYALSTDGIHWKYGVASTMIERWLSVQYGDGLFIVNSGNSSKEYAVGRLQGSSQDSIQWSVFSNMPNSYHSVMYYCDGSWLVCSSNSGTTNSYDIHVYNPDEGNFSHLISVARNGMNVNLATNTMRIWDEKLYVADSFGLDVIDLSTMTLTSTFKISDVDYYDTIKFNNDVYLYGRKNYASVYKVTESGLKQMVSLSNRSTNIIEHNGYLFWLGNGEENNSTIVCTNYFSRETTGENTRASIETENPIQLLPYGDDILVVSGTLRYSTASNSDFVYSIKASSLRSIPPVINNVNRWEEIPILASGNDALIMRKNNQLQAIEKFKQLKFEEGGLAVDSSDEYQAPMGYKCIPLNSDNPILYCPVPLNEVRTEASDDLYETEVFLDSQCEDYFGYITNKDFNINNPTEIEVTVWQDGRESQLYYLLSEELYPDTVATSRAVMELSKKLKPNDYAYPVYLGYVGWEDERLYEISGNFGLDLPAGQHAEEIFDLESIELNDFPNLEVDESYPYFDFQVLNFSGTYSDYGAVRQICEDREEDGTFVSMKAEGTKLFLSYNKTEDFYTEIYFQCRFIMRRHAPV